MKEISINLDSISRTVLLWLSAVVPEAAAATLASSCWKARWARSKNDTACLISRSSFSGSVHVNVWKEKRRNPLREVSGIKRNPLREVSGIKRKPSRLKYGPRNHLATSTGTCNFLWYDEYDSKQLQRAGDLKNWFLWPLYGQHLMVKRGQHGQHLHTTSHAPLSWWWLDSSLSKEAASMEPVKSSSARLVWVEGGILISGMGDIIKPNLHNPLWNMLV